jgi:predicted O-methyltransferase YrrM
MRLRHLPHQCITLARVALHRLLHGGKPMLKFDWTSRHREHWMAALGGLADRPVDVLEIGSYEGGSALFFLDALPLAHVTCVDLFSPRRSATFDHNVSRHSGRVTKLPGRSAAVLDRLLADGRRYDVIYVDGSHRRIDVMVDSVLAWGLLQIGGIIIWDDYLLDPAEPPAKRPQHAIDAFFTAFRPCLHELHRDYQIIARKTAEWPEPAPSHAGKDDLVQDERGLDVVVGRAGAG